MEKKKYIAPVMEIVELEVTTMLAASIGFGEEGKDADDAWTNRRRGTWGNLWADDEKE